METTPCFTDDLLNFPSDISDFDNDDDNDNNHHLLLSPHHHRRRRRAFSLLPHPSVSSEFVEEEELEWISNKDAFPMVETFVDIIPNNASFSSSNNVNNNNNGSDLSPVSVLENSSTSGSINSFNFSISSKRNENKHYYNNNNNLISLRGSFKVPGKARTKQLRKPRREMSRKWFQCWEKTVSKPSIGRKCLHCGSEKTPQWRAGPLGPKTLCNACGVRYKSGRLVPEYRPASSPTFSSEVHSNSHRKIVEMRKQKMMMGGEPDFKPGDF
ncbi:hypothetical protein RND81_14G067000 [Saponaria officinalis]|uniref:GATA-type domain-containing protein n=1 Tax=Saponaria officinalis TaxID=3572 RepID=A0AAW1GJB1_SAPOF